MPKKKEVLTQSQKLAIKQAKEAEMSRKMKAAAAAHKKRKM